MDLPSLSKLFQDSECSMLERYEVVYKQSKISVTQVRKHDPGFAIQFTPKFQPSNIRYVENEGAALLYLEKLKGLIDAHSEVIAFNPVEIEDPSPFQVEYT